MRDAPPTDSELFEKGLGFHPTPPAIAMSELQEASSLYKKGLTPRRVVPPSEVALAVEMHRAAERSRANTPTHDSEGSRYGEQMGPRPIPSPLHLAGSSFIGSKEQSPLVSPTSSLNGYSLGSELPRGASWRYVDILGNSDKLI